MICPAEGTIKHALPTTALNWKHTELEGMEDDCKGHCPLRTR